MVKYKKSNHYQKVFLVSQENEKTVNVDKAREIAKLPKGKIAAIASVVGIFAVIAVPVFLFPRRITTII